MDEKGVRIVLYRWAGRKLFWSIRSECEECDLSVHLIRDLLDKELAKDPFTFEIRNWLDHLWESLLRGGWHAPVITVNGRVFSQGVVPDREKLLRKLRASLRR